MVLYPKDVLFLSMPKLSRNYEKRNLKLLNSLWYFTANSGRRTDKTGRPRQGRLTCGLGCLAASVRLTRPWHSELITSTWLIKMKQWNYTLILLQIIFILTNIKPNLRLYKVHTDSPLLSWISVFKTSIVHPSFFSSSIFWVINT